MVQLEAEPAASETRRLTGSEFSAVVAAVTSAFGDPTRRQVYLYVRDSGTGATASQVAQHFSLHPNVARHHLQRLVDGGYVRVETGRTAAGAGRPSKRYFCVEEELQLGLMQRRDDLLMRLLGEAMRRLGPDEAEAMWKPLVASPDMNVRREARRQLAATRAARRHDR